MACTNAVKVLASPEAVEEAREATRKLLVDGRIALAANADRSIVSGPVHFKDLGQHVLELVGWPRNPKSMVAGVRYAICDDVISAVIPRGVRGRRSKVA